MAPREQRPPSPGARRTGRPARAAEAAPTEKRTRARPPSRKSLGATPGVKGREQQTEQVEPPPSAKKRAAPQRARSRVKQASVAPSAVKRLSPEARQEESDLGRRPQPQARQSGRDYSHRGEGDATNGHRPPTPEAKQGANVAAEVTGTRFTEGRSRTDRSDESFGLGLLSLSGPFAFPRISRQWGRANAEATMFVGRRAKALLEFPLMLASCRSPADFWRQQILLMTDAMTDAQKTAMRIAFSLLDDMGRDRQ